MDIPRFLIATGDELVKIILDNYNPYEFNEILTQQNNIFYNRVDLLKDDIYKGYLDKYQVDYTDSVNFIYKANQVSQNSFKRGNTWDWRGLMELYMKHFKETVINCEDIGITSFPIYPNMIEFYGGNNDLTSFPVQPKMEVFNASDNNLTSFPVQPRMEEFKASKNNLTSFPIQPNMTTFVADNNNLVSFPIQPMMNYFSANNNKLTTFPRQPRMVSFSGVGNRIQSFPTQPYMEDFNGDNIVNFYPQPNLETVIMNNVEQDPEAFRPNDEGYSEETI